MTCVFCDIVAGRAPASVVYEDSDTMAFLDLYPMTSGHLLVIPKAHYRNLFDAPPALAARVMEVGATLAPALQRVTQCAGMNAYIANEAPAGQVVWHLHLHLIPRYAGDGFGLRVPAGYGRSAPRQELDELAGALRAALSTTKP